MPSPLQPRSGGCVIATGPPQRLPDLPALRPAAKMNYSCLTGGDLFVPHDRDNLYVKI